MTNIPGRPEKGDRALACKHRPRPGNAHYFYVASGLEAVLHDGTRHPCVWVLACDRCYHKHRKNITKAELCTTVEEVTAELGLPDGTVRR